MSKLSKSEIINKFRKGIDKEDLTEDIKVTYRIRGGMPSERIEEEFSFSGNGKAEVKRLDFLRSIPSEKVSTELDRVEIHDLFKNIDSSLDSLVSLSEAHFPPDSLVGSITIEIEGEKTTLYFLTNEEEGQARPILASSKAVESFQRIREISQRILKEGREESK